MFSKLDYVYSVYTEGSFTAAAKKLFISQPSLSSAIKNIETEVGAPIFERTSGGIKLTEIGKEYISAAERIIGIREDFKNRLNDIYGLSCGSITVGGTNYLSSYVLPRIINRFTELYPNIKVTLVEANSKNLSELIKKEEIDIVIDSFDGSLDDYEGFPLINEDILLCVPNESPINSSLSEYSITPADIQCSSKRFSEVAPVSLELFKNESFVLLKEGNDMHYRAAKFFADAEITPKVSFSVDQLNISFSLVESGMGICFVTDTLFRYGAPRDRVTLYKVSPEHSDRTLYVAHKKNKYCTSAMAKFIEISREVIKK